MALDVNDIMMLRGMDKEGFSPYEQVKINHMQSKHASSTAIGGLATAVGAAVVGLTGWFFAASQSKAAKDLAISKNDDLRQLVMLQAQTIAAERAERITGDTNISQTITDSISGQQSSSLTSTQQAQLDAYQQLMVQLGTGEYTKNPKKVELYSPAQPFQCGCGCNG